MPRTGRPETLDCVTEYVVAHDSSRQRRQDVDSQVRAEAANAKHTSMFARQSCCLGQESISPRLLDEFAQNVLEHIRKVAGGRIVKFPSLSHRLWKTPVDTWCSLSNDSTLSSSCPRSSESLTAKARQDWSHSRSPPSARHHEGRAAQPDATNPSWEHQLCLGRVGELMARGTSSQAL